MITRSGLATIALALLALAISDARLLACQSTAAGQPGLVTANRRADFQTNANFDSAQALLQSVRAASFPELSHTVIIRVREFHSSGDYFRTRFSVARYASLRKMRFYLEVNLRVFELGAPAEAVRAIIAHELEHVLYLSRRSRLSMLSLARLASAKYTTRFERGADLGAIGRGYGSGLIVYRQWLYQHIPPGALAAKRRDYFSPEEISAIQSIIQKHPETLSYWSRHVPLSIEDIHKQAPSR
jgi:hypothetical protein